MTYRIGEVAQRVGMSVEGLRFYERRGLLAPAGRSPSRYRLYGDREVRTVLFIKAAQEMGFTLAEIDELLELRSGDAGNCIAMRDRLATKLDAVRRRISLLRGLEKDLAAGVKKCDQQIDSGRASECPVLEDWDADAARD